LHVDGPLGLPAGPGPGKTRVFAPAATATQAFLAPPIATTPNPAVSASSRRAVSASSSRAAALQKAPCASSFLMTMARRRSGVSG
jgi:hypothetical protein